MLNQQIAHDCKTEVIEAHRFFTEWFTGVLPDTDATWAALEDTLAPGFVLVTPGGRLIEREALLQGIRANHGQHEDTGFEIWIENFECRLIEGDVVVATYEEWQTLGDDTTGRLSTAIFERNPAMPNHVRWLHVHETWLPSSA